MLVVEGNQVGEILHAGAGPEALQVFVDAGLELEVEDERRKLGEDVAVVHVGNVRGIDEDRTLALHVLEGFLEERDHAVVESGKVAGDADSRARESVRVEKLGVVGV